MLAEFEKSKELLDLSAKLLKKRITKYMNTLKLRAVGGKQRQVSNVENNWWTPDLQNELIVWYTQGGKRGRRAAKPEAAPSMHWVVKSASSTPPDALLGRTQEEPAPTEWVRGWVEPDSDEENAGEPAPTDWARGWVEPDSDEETGDADGMDTPHDNENAGDSDGMDTPHAEGEEHQCFPSDQQGERGIVINPRLVFGKNSPWWTASAADLMTTWGFTAEAAQIAAQVVAADAEDHFATEVASLRKRCRLDEHSSDELLVELKRRRVID